MSDLIEETLVFTHVVNFYLAPTPPDLLDKDFEIKTAQYNTKLELQTKIVALATQPTADSPELLAGYVREALRKSAFHLIIKARTITQHTNVCPIHLIRS